MALLDASRLRSRKSQEAVKRLEQRSSNALPFELATATNILRQDEQIGDYLTLTNPGQIQVQSICNPKHQQRD